MQKGTSLAEALVCLCLITLLIGLAIPTWQRMLARQQLAELRNTLQQDLAYARTQAVMQQMPIAIAPSQAGCWQCGWRIGVDANGNGRLDAGEHETLSKPAANSALSIESNTPLRLGAIYSGDGAARQPSGAFLAATFVLCHTSLPEQYLLIISRSGRVRASQRASGCL